jgi:ribosome maturation factor RimP
MNDFLRCRNRTVQFFLKEPVGGRLEWTGKITAASEDAVHINHDGQVITLPLASISKATQTL